ncbi:MAG: DUF58 domain-containing protein [Methanomassiliicoccus sp.]|nr:MAG: DUF58 domain-containing protein [Methanomassiliicoccus sp.]
MTPRRKALTARIAPIAVIMMTGLFLGNMALMIISLVPWFFLAFSIAIPGPRVSRLEGEIKKGALFVGRDLKVERETTIDHGMGLVVLAESISPTFEQRDGKAIRVLWKGRGVLNAPFNYTIRPMRRGEYEIGNVRSEGIHFSGLFPSDQNVWGSKRSLHVEQMVMRASEIRDPRLESRMPMPASVMSSHGAQTTNFLDIRHYQRGDQFRSINWKATVRSGDVEALRPLVNEYEREGRRKVWILVDDSERMRVGNEAESAFECALHAARALSDFYLQRNCLVGAALIHQGRCQLPEGGRRQKIMLADMLYRADVKGSSGSLTGFVHGHRGHLQQGNPLFIIISILDRGSQPELREGFKELRRNSGPKSRFLLIDVDLKNIASRDEVESLGIQLRGLEETPVRGRIKKLGVRIVSWEPREQDLFQVLLTSRAVGGEFGS